MMRKNASRMRILSVYDLPHASAVRALALLRKDAAPSSPAPTQSTLEEIVKLIGGRTSYLTRVARAFDMLEEARFMVRSEREWLMSQLSPPSLFSPGKRRLRTSRGLTGWTSWI